MEESLQRRVAANESVAREVNEAIERGLWPGEQGEAAVFRCECARLDCNQLLTLTPAEYERVRADSRRFLVAPGHQVPAAETVVETFTDYVVVEKTEEAGRSAERSDPRSG